MVSAQDPVTLTIESWRNDDLGIWRDTIIPAFEAAHPDIHVEFAPTAPTEYNAALAAKLEAGTAGDLITCRPFDQSLDLFNNGQLADITDLPGLENFSDVAKSAWITDDGTQVFCVPMASVIHGFLYNKAIFDELGLTEPTTEAEFMAVLQAIKDNGQYAPLVMGTTDQWEAATMGYQNIGPSYWHGEEGRKGLIDGTAKYNEGGFLQAFEALAAWTPYLPDGYQAQTYVDSQNMFTLGQGVIYPAGSWDIGTFNPLVDFEMGAFPPPVPEAGDTCYISDHTDIAMGMNAATAHPEEARTFLEWMTGPEFADLYTNALPGFFTLSNHPVEVADPLAAEFLSWRDTCESTIRSSYQILSRDPDLNNELDLWAASAAVLNGTQTAQEAADTVQDRLAQWYEPQMAASS
jgi:raffinose/stachyose/melibiose transport system substrate-binding protein